MAATSSALIEQVPKNNYSTRKGTFKPEMNVGGRIEHHHHCIFSR
jgi:hypothetical protein